MKKFLRNLAPKPVLMAYHAVLNWLSMAAFGFPTRKLITIGVTGTNGKTSTVSYIDSILTSAGYKSGFISTATIKIGSKKRINTNKMTMPGRWSLAKLLHQIKMSGALYAIIETSSQGLEMHRHLGVAYDIAVFTNLTPEHIEAHGSFENYRKAKERLFAALSKTKRKPDIKKISVVNGDDSSASHFLQYDADEKWTFSLGKQEQQASHLVSVEQYVCSPRGIDFTLRRGDERVDISTKLVGAFNLKNILAAVAVAMSQDISLDKIKTAVEAIETVPGRMEPINEGQPFTVIVDYAVVPESLELVYKALREKLAEGRRLIAVLGSAGGGRDKAKRPVMGATAARFADLVVLTNEDPYDEDPRDIINQIGEGLAQAGKTEGVDYVKKVDREDGMRWAINNAKEGDIVVVTGKGCETVIIGKNGQRVAHDDRVVARKLLRNLNNSPE